MTGSHAHTPADDPVLAEAILLALTSDPTHTTALIKALHRRVYDPDTLLDLMERVARAAVDTLTGVHWAGVTAQLDGRPFMTGVTDDCTQPIDHQQYQDNGGPGITATRTDNRVTMTLTEVAARWPSLAETAALAGVRSFLAVPLHAHQHCVGALNMYSADSAPPEGDRILLAVLTAYLDRGLTDYSDRRSGPSGEVDLRTALADAAVVEQAVGVMMAVYGFNPEYARCQLIDHAADAGRNLIDHAAHILNRSIASPN